MERRKAGMTKAEGRKDGRLPAFVTPAFLPSVPEFLPSCFSAFLPCENLSDRQNMIRKPRRARRGLIQRFGFWNVEPDDSMTAVRLPPSGTPWLFRLNRSR